MTAANFTELLYLYRPIGMLSPIDLAQLSFVNRTEMKNNMH